MDEPGIPAVIDHNAACSEPRFKDVYVLVEKFAILIINAECVYRVHDKSLEECNKESHRK